MHSQVESGDAHPILWVYGRMKWIVEVQLEQCLEEVLMLLLPLK